ncbi:phage portal protein, HK97 family [Thermaerobacter marianensis DSM] [Mycobacterium shimoidei]|uniref:Phage portal protein, HK97 family [Thermaerobacter marianensis DSM] n=1 Tax=Mycobacterium shimoidei TaxID=29313 RepID=A0A375YXH4_MYCSH|nr:phage portal protein [Mycobacterium shimoidei]SRX93569.1 phage portal protein, HK97 family [Thermaerobacter marianensis DSM] [Mycobacterium shimoidei]
MRFLDRLRGAREPERMTLEEYVMQLNQFAYNGLSYGFLGSGYGNPIQQTLGGQATLLAPNNFVGLATAAYEANGVVFACMLVRQLVFSSVRFRWQRLRDGKPSDTFGTAELSILERPWAGGTTQDLLSRMIQDADLCGNSYWTLHTPLPQIGTSDPTREFVRMRPDWVDIIVEERQLPGGRGQVGWRKAGYAYTEGGRHAGADPVGLLPDEVVHFAPIPDPLADYRGMSWLTPILREIQADQAMTRHQRKFFDNGATVNMVIKHALGASEDAVKKWAQEMEGKHAGPDNAYKTLHLYPGADATPVGSNLKDIDFDNVRAGGEVRIAAAAGVPPVIVGLTKGLDSSTYSNYSQARRRLADGTAHPLWENLSGCIEHVLSSPGPDVRLWYDADNVPFLREDEKDAAGIQQTRATTINSLITAGYEPDSVIAAVEANDFRLLVHSGLYSVQLQQPGTDFTANGRAATNGQPQGGLSNGAVVN